MGADQPLTESKNKGPIRRGVAIDAARQQNAQTPLRRAWWLLAAAALAVFLVLTIGYSVTRSPWWDEGMFADVAMHFRNTGHLGSIVLAPHGYLNWPGVHEYTYWQLPLYLLTEGVWLRMVPATIQYARLLSVIWGCVYLAAWFLFVRGLTGDGALSTFVTAVVAMDYAVLSAASDARMDMMCAALGELGLASYVSLRTSKPILATALAGLFGAASLFCHPMGAVTTVSIIAIILFLDRRSICWRGVPFAALFYLVGFALCIRYAMENAAIYHAQSSAAASYRIATVAGALHSILYDLRNRYFAYYFWFLEGAARLKVCSLLFGLAGVAGIALTPRLRSEVLGKVLLLLAAITYVCVALVDNQDFPIYFIYSAPVLTVCGAFWAYRCWARPLIWRSAAGALLVAATIASTGAFAVKIHANDFRRQYLSAVQVIKANLPAGGTVFGGAELGFALGFGPQLVDDRYLGYGSRAPLPALYVMDPNYVGMRSEKTAWQESRKTLAKQYRLIYRNQIYRIYLRDDLPKRS
ncbi:MAG: hypothetical protein JO319_03585 [Acidobacteriaceae bacterium]|nr:hypothetical protein [Acidobacteriaceae bacterium]